MTMMVQAAGSGTGAALTSMTSACPSAGASPARFTEMLSCVVLSAPRKSEALSGSIEAPAILTPEKLRSGPLNAPGANSRGTRFRMVIVLGPTATMIPSLLSRNEVVSTKGLVPSVPSKAPSVGKM